ncbi:related to effector family protein Eff1 [Sporisorium reilianum f. sp. reilianum]|uniref:Related to effector family protein Eff1 n=1 Tax=Sporisorium reilianum f. sp. reilianum TaxID=72559 RepID=A0A2N8UBX8_9BASI|nr:related to effector family protein Eff1 [Sporisorium reilianum f. sp. reilianum]
MRRAVFWSFVLLLSLLGASSKPMRLSGQGSSSALPSSGFDWQEHHYPQTWSPDPMPQIWPDETPFEDTSGDGHGTGVATSDTFRSTSALKSATKRAKKEPYSALEAKALETTLRKALGQPDLVLAANDPKHADKPRLFVAHNPSIPDDSHVSDPRQTAPSSPPSSPRDSTGTLGSFEAQLKMIPRLDIKKLREEKAQNRRIIYLKSRTNMDYINSKYFKDKLKVLPINEKAMTWYAIRKMLMDRRALVVLPPLEKDGLGLLLASYVGQQSNGEKHTMTGIQKMTGPLQDTSWLVSLWSPVLSDGKRSIMVLYGIGQLGSSEIKATAEHLEGLELAVQGLDPLSHAFHSVRT